MNHSKLLLNNHLTGLFALLLCVACDGDNHPPPAPDDQLPFVGKWQVEAAMEDGLLVSAWQGLELEIEQLETNGGAFHFYESPDTLVWPLSGTWVMDDTTRIVRNDDITMMVGFTGETKLNTVFFVDRGQVEIACPEYPCSADPAGTWSFTFSSVL
ncbi:MAG: hypothetical protein RIG68_11175 [Imperialibacter sp.]|uniref:hypothetical protein n=1 Tax=Imperialibacter sp. TaxID=2038411 RepID=UPI0032ECF743